MILVIAVMRQAGNPRIYEVFFLTPEGDAALPMPATGEWAGEAFATDQLASVGLLASGPASSAPPHSDHARVFAEHLDQTLASLGDAKTADLMQAMAADRAAQMAKAARGLKSEDPTTAPWEPWPALLDEAFSAANAGRDDRMEPPDWFVAEIRFHLQAALDRWAIARVDPAAVWKASDTLGFYRLLEDDRQRAAVGQASRASVTALVQQPDAYLHRRVALPGSVARVIRRSAAKNPFGVDHYWEVWLRPRDGSERPFVLFTGEVSATLAAVSDDAALPDGPPVWVDGIFLKRLAYRSSLGRELAPAIVGVVREPATVPRLDLERAASPAPRGWVLVAISAGIGCSIAAMIFVLSGKSLAQSRKLRQKTRPSAPDFLAVIDNPSLTDLECADRQSQETRS